MMRMSARLFRIFLVSMACLFALTGYSSAEIPPSKHILIIHSYDSNYPWTENVRRGINEVLKSAGSNVEIYEKFMDMKRMSGDEYLERFRDYCRAAFKDIRFDAILVADNDALNFINKYRDEILPGVPVVFCGINDFHADMLQGRKDLTGVVETLEYKGTIELALKLRPLTRRVVVVTDDTTTGLAHRHAVEDIAASFRDRVRFEYLSLGQMSMPEMAGRLGVLDNKAVVLLLQNNKDRTGRTYAHDYGTALLTRVSRVPCFAVIDTRLGLGALGGKVSSGLAQGRTAAAMVLKILRGADVGSIPLVMESPNQYIFDANVLNRFHISRDLIPRGSLIINSAQGFWDKYRIELMIFLIIFLIAVLYLLMIAREVRRRLNTEEMIKRQNELLESASEAAEVALWQWDIATGELEWADVADRMLGYAPEKFSRTIAGWEAALHPEDRARVMAQLNAHINDGARYDVEYRICRRDGSHVWWRDIGICRRDAQGRACRMSGACIDVTDKRAAESRLDAERRLLKTLIDNMPDSIYFKDKDGRKILNNPADMEFIGSKDLKDVIGKTDADVFPPHLAQKYIQDDISVLQYGNALINREEMVEDRHGISRWLLTSKLPIKDSSGSVIGLVGIGRDITDRKMLESKLLNMAHYDTLTSLPNRSLFIERANAGLAQAKRTGNSCAMLFVDLDHFKTVNDTLGHSVGDELLRDTALKLAECVREMDTIARLGGDEFIVFLNGLDQGEDAQQIAERIRDKFNTPRLVTGNDLFITASVGISTYPNDGDDLENLLKNADTAMYAAKDAGRNGFCFFDHDMNRKAVTKMQIERGLRNAITRSELRLFYQPIVAVRDGGIRGFEALLRWFPSEGGLVLPNEFIPVAEETGLIVPIGEWVLREACRFNKRMIDAGHGKLVISVNISVVQLRRKDFIHVLGAVLAQTGLPPECLEIEVTETILIESFDAAVSTLSAICRLGVQISLDDFGTGFSSLSHLQRLPITNLKIDRLFIKEMLEVSQESDLTPAIIDLAHKLKLKVVAEGVETEFQLGRLKRDDCDFFQGFFLSRPLPEDKLIDFIRDHNARTFPDLTKPS